MTKLSEIPHLINLLDDDSDDVRIKVASELASFGPILKKEVGSLNLHLNNIQQAYLNSIFKEQKRVQLKKDWAMWMFIRDDSQKLEKALSILSEYLIEQDKGLKLSMMLDGLTHAYKEKHKTIDAKLLAQFLFKEKGLHGNENDYYNPQNNNLYYVIRYKKGIPISLASVYILVGKRLGLDIEGCHFPGHFLARINHAGKRMFVDCFNYGQIIQEKDLSSLRTDIVESIDTIINEKASAVSIVRRFLANLIRAYQIQEDEENSTIMIELFKDLEERNLFRKKEGITPEQIIEVNPAEFNLGEVVIHKRYGYRGIIVEIDSECCATESWYYSNQTQPERDQPWFHVLVDGSDQVTYVAQSNLIKDVTNNDVIHPLLNYFFSQDDEGRYTRNDNPWPETDF